MWRQLMHETEELVSSLWFPFRKTKVAFDACDRRLLEFRANCDKVRQGSAGRTWYVRWRNDVKYPSINWSLWNTQHHKHHYCNFKDYKIIKLHSDDLSALKLRPHTVHLNLICTKICAICWSTRLLSHKSTQCSTRNLTGNLIMQLHAYMCTVSVTVLYILITVLYILNQILILFM